MKHDIGTKVSLYCRTNPDVKRSFRADQNSRLSHVGAIPGFLELSTTIQETLENEME
jgi:hypothetical protein